MSKLQQQLPAPQIKNAYNARYAVKFPEINNHPSLTIPDQTMSVKTILDRHSRGLPLGAPMRVPIYDENDPMPDLKTMDLAEIQELREANADRIKNMQEELYKPKQSAKPTKKADKPADPPADPKTDDKLSDPK